MKVKNVKGLSVLSNTRFCGGMIVRKGVIGYVFIESTS